MHKPWTLKEKLLLQEFPSGFIKFLSYLHCSATHWLMDAWTIVMKYLVKTKMSNLSKASLIHLNCKSKVYSNLTVYPR